MRVAGVFILIIFAWACKSTGPIQENKEKKEISHKSTRALLDSMKNHEFQYDWLSLKTKIIFIEDSIQNDFKSTIRIKHDSAIWISITPLLGIEVVRLLLTPDTIVFLDRINKRYFTGNYEFFSEKLNIEVDYFMIQSLLTGNSIDFDDNEKVKSAIDREKALYYITTNKKRKLRKYFRKEKERKIKDDIQILWIDPNTFKIKSIYLTDNDIDQTLIAEYDNYVFVDNQYFPGLLKFYVDGNKDLQLKIEIDKVTMGSEYNLSINIPEKYEPIR